MFKFIALLALVACAYAIAPVCNDTLVCLKENEVGCNAVSPSYAVGCADGTICTSGTCRARPRLAASCSITSPCWDPKWALSCNSGTCKYENIYGPGDACKASTETNFVNGGCRTGTVSLTCSTSGTCSSIAVGSSCATDPLACAVHAFCNTTTGNCQTRKSANAECGGDWECDETLICTSRGAAVLPTCQSPFAQASGSTCSHILSLDCAVNTACIGGRCVARTNDGQVCTTDIDICDDNQACVCDVEKRKNNLTENGDAHCENPDFITQAIIDAYNGMQSCVKSRNCHDAWSMLHQGLVVGPDQCIRGCLRRDFETSYEELGRKFNSCSGSASFIFPSLAVLLVLFALALMM